MDDGQKKLATDQEFLTAREVMKELGITQYRLYQEIEAGTIPSILPPGKKKGIRFPADAIKTLARRRRQEQIAARVVRYTFVPSTVADVYVAVKNAQRVYGDEDSISFERALQWRDLNSDISMSVKDGRHLVGMVTLLPLDQEVILALLSDRMRERDIPDDAIRQWADTALSVYIAGIAIVPSGDAEQDAQRGRFLLDHTLRWAITLSSLYDIKNWYGLGITPQGQELMENLGFREVVSLENGVRKGYVLESLEAANIATLQRFRARMAAR